MLWLKIMTLPRMYVVYVWILWNLMYNKQTALVLMLGNEDICEAFLWGMKGHPPFIISPYKLWTIKIVMMDVWLFTTLPSKELYK